MHRAASHDVFLSYTWADTAKVDELHAALARRGLRVVRDRDMTPFAPVTKTLSDAVDDSAVLVAFYSRAFPARYACQWELTRAFLAAQSRGDRPETRVLVINPEGDEHHIEPVQLTDQSFGRWPHPGGVDALATWVAEKVDATGRTRMGAPEPADPAALGPQFARNEWFAGRYTDLWRVHSALTHGGLPLVKDPHPRSVVLVKAITGLGKSALARRYGFLFGQGYPGGMYWTDLHSGGTRLTGEAMLTIYREHVAEDHDLPPVEIDELRVLLARRFDAAAKPVLWIIDDLPDGPDRHDLDRMIIPSRWVSTVVTARAVSADWPVPVVELSGLTGGEAVELFRRYWPDMNDADARAVAGLSERSGGHPFTLGAMAHTLRGAQGTDLGARVMAADGTVDEVLTGIVRGLASSTRLVLSYAAVLSQAPFTTDLVTSGLAGLLNESAVADALGELRDHSLVRAAIRARQAWQVHALVAAVARADTPERTRGLLAVRAADALVSRLPGTPDLSDLHSHARAVATNDAVPTEDRRALLRAAVAAYEEHGDLITARDTALTAVSISGGDVTDELAAARLAIATGVPDLALDLCDRVLARPGHTPADAYRARFAAAAAHDLHGRFLAADEVFPAQEEIPSDLPLDEARRIELGRIVALRHRGVFKEAHSRLDTLMGTLQREHPRGPHRAPWSGAAVELARLQTRLGEIKAARVTSQEIVELFDAARLPHHPTRLAAVRAHAEAQLAVAFTDHNVTSATWVAAAGRIGELHAAAKTEYGDDNPHTLELAVTHARALHASSDRAGARALLDDVEPRVAAVLGADHPLRHLARSTRGRVYMGDGRYERAREIFEDLLPRQVAAIGRDHPDTLVTQFDLAIHLLLAQPIQRDRAVRLLNDVRARQTGKLNWWQDDHLKTVVAMGLAPLPGVVWRLFGRFYRP